MNTNLSRNRSTAKVAGVLEPSVAAALDSMLGRERLGLSAAGIDPGALAVALLGSGSVDFSQLMSVDPFAIFPDVFPEAAKRKVVEDEDEGDDDDSDDDDEVDDDEDEEVEEDEDLDEEDDDEDEDDDEEDDEDEDEDEEEDEFDDPDDDDDYDDDDDDDFDDDE